jgi:hypothetical protein
VPLGKDAYARLTTLYRDRAIGPPQSRGRCCTTCPIVRARR